MYMKKAGCSVIADNMIIWGQSVLHYVKNGKTERRKIYI